MGARQLNYKSILKINHVMVSLDADLRTGERIWQRLTLSAVFNIPPPCIFLTRNKHMR
jgi:hypothetical protein